MPQDIRTFCGTVGRGIITNTMIEQCPQFRIFIQRRNEDAIRNSLDVMRKYFRKKAYKMQSNIDHNIVDITFIPAVQTYQIKYTREILDLPLENVEKGDIIIVTINHSSTMSDELLNYGIENLREKVKFPLLVSMGLRDNENSPYYRKITIAVY